VPSASFWRPSTCLQLGTWGTELLYQLPLNPLPVRPAIAASSLGPGFYEVESQPRLPTPQACLRFHTTTNLTAQQIHDMGLSEVERIEGEMLLIVKEMGWDSSPRLTVTSLQLQ
jgi:hypothetical protein